MNSLREMRLGGCGRSLLRLERRRRLLALELLRREWLRSAEESPWPRSALPAGRSIASMARMSSPHSRTSLLSCPTSSASRLFSSLLREICAPRNSTMRSNFPLISSCPCSISAREAASCAGSLRSEDQRSSQDLKGQFGRWPGLLGEAVEGESLWESLLLGGGWLAGVLALFCFMESIYYDGNFNSFRLNAPTAKTKAELPQMNAAYPLREVDGSNILTNL